MQQKTRKTLIFLYPTATVLTKTLKSPAMADLTSPRLHQGLESIGLVGGRDLDERRNKKEEGNKREKIKENHRKHIGKLTIIIMAIFGNFMVKLYLNNWFNGLIGFSRFGLV